MRENLKEKKVEENKRKYGSKSSLPFFLSSTPDKMIQMLLGLCLAWWKMKETKEMEWEREKIINEKGK